MVHRIEDIGAETAAAFAGHSTPQGAGGNGIPGLALEAVEQVGRPAWLAGSRDDGGETPATFTDGGVRRPWPAPAGTWTREPVKGAG